MTPPEPLLDRHRLGDGVDETADGERVLAHGFLPSGRHGRSGSGWWRGSGGSCPEKVPPGCDSNPAYDSSEGGAT